MIRPDPQWGWYDVLQAIDQAPPFKRYLGALRREIGCSANYLRLVLARLERDGLIRRDTEAGRKPVELTRTGKDILHAVLQVRTQIQKLREGEGKQEVE